MLFVRRDTQNTLTHWVGKSRILNVKHGGIWSIHWAFKDYDCSLLRAESSLGDSTYCLFYTVKTGTVCSTETLLCMYQTTWHDIPGEWDCKSQQFTETLAMNDSVMPIAYSVFCFFTSVINFSKDVPVLVSLWILGLWTHTPHQSKTYFSYFLQGDKKGQLCPAEDWKYGCSQLMDWVLIFPVSGRYILRKWEGVVTTRWSWLRIGTGGGRLWVQ